mmetsp:Transcript_66349/g.154159  ORF Transcript_66349/g.154159 Transcript_66349/m.154159 type:complete len:348 (+) Transcript_66349:51-1094(+)
MAGAVACPSLLGKLPVHCDAQISQVDKNFMRMVSAASTEALSDMEDSLPSPSGSFPDCNAQDSDEHGFVWRRKQLDDLQSDLARWAQVAVDEENSGSGPIFGSELSVLAQEQSAPRISMGAPLRSKMGRWAQAVVQDFFGPALPHRCFNQHRHRRGQHARQAYPQLRPLRSELGRFAEAICLGGPVLQSELGRWAEAQVADQERLEVAPPAAQAAPVVVDLAGVVHGTAESLAQSASDRYGRVARLKRFYCRRQLRQAESRAAVPHAPTRWCVDVLGAVREVVQVPASRAFNFAAALRLKRRLALRRLSKDLGPLGILAVDTRGVVEEVDQCALLSLAQVDSLSLSE